jgi:hypothetical protein
MCGVVWCGVAVRGQGLFKEMNGCCARLPHATASLRQREAGAGVGEAWD